MGGKTLATSAEADVVVVGAGHNALAAAAYLSAAGLQVTILERSDQIGGDTMSEELTLPGFIHDSCSSAHTVIQANPMLRENELSLDAFGLRYIRPDPVFVVPFEDGTSLSMYPKAEETAKEISRLSSRDAEAYLELLEDWQALRPLQAEERGGPPKTPEAFQTLWRSGPLGDEGLRIRMATGLEIIEERFEHPRVRAMIAWVATMTLEPLDRPGTGLLPFSLTSGRQVQSWTTPEGGSGALPEALAALIRKAGGTVVTAAEVVRIEREEGRARAVRTADGSVFRARRAILSSQHVTQLPDALGEEAFDAGSLRAIRRWHAGLTMFVTHYALAEAPLFRTSRGLLPSVAMGHLESTSDLRDLLHAFRVGKVTTEHPFLLVLNSSCADTSRAPVGRHTLKIVGIQPYERADGGPTAWDAAKEDMSEALLERYLALTANLTHEHILARHIESPLDLERRNPNNFRGSCHAGDNDYSQAGYFRPTPRWNAYRTPVAGLYLTGASTHPGGSVSAYPGRNAARVMLEDLGIPFEAALAGAKALAGR